MGDGLSEFVNDIAIPFLIFQTLSTARIPSEQPWGDWLSYFGGVAVVWTLSTWIAGRFFHYGRLPRVVAGFAAGQATRYRRHPVDPQGVRQGGRGAALPPHRDSFPRHHDGGDRACRGRPSAGDGNHSRLGRHPILIAMALGAAARRLGISVAELAPIKSVLDMVAASAVPCALFSMGIAMRRYGLQAGIALPSIVTAIKIILHPLIVYLLAAKLFAIDPVWPGVATLFAACPCGINAYLFAHKYKEAADFAATAIAISTAAAAVTVTLWIWYLAPHTAGPERHRGGISAPVALVEPASPQAESPTRLRISSGLTPLARLAQARRGDALRELAPVLVKNEPMVVIIGLGKPQQLLQKPVDGSRRTQVVAAHDLRHALRRVIDGDGKVIARRRIAAQQDHIAPGERSASMGRRLRRFRPRQARASERAGNRARLRPRRRQPCGSPAPIRFAASSGSSRDKPPGRGRRRRDRAAISRRFALRARRRRGRASRASRSRGRRGRAA